VATKLATLLRRRGTIVLALVVVAVIAGAFSPMGMWDGPL
jgi:hypothetical protein